MLFCGAATGCLPRLRAPPPIQKHAWSNCCSDPLVAPAAAPQLACLSLAGGYRQEAGIDTLSCCRDLKPPVPHPPPQSSQVASVFRGLAAHGVNNTFVRGGPAPRERHRSGLIIGSLDPCLSPIDLSGLPRHAASHLPLSTRRLHEWRTAARWPPPLSEVAPAVAPGDTMTQFRATN